MDDFNRLLTLHGSWLNPEYGEDIFSAGHSECDVECDLCGELSPENKTIRYGGKTICFCCVEIILEKYKEAR